MPVRPGDARLCRAQEFLTEQILAQHRSKAAVYRRCGLPPRITVPTSDWLVFGALLTGDRCHPSMCGSLTHYAVRATLIGGPIAYQFVQDEFDSDLKTLQSSGHLVIQHTADLSRVEVWGFSGAAFTEGFEQLGGRQFLLQSRFTDPEVEFAPQWLATNAVPLLFFEENRVIFIDHRLWESEDYP